MTTVTNYFAFRLQLLLLVVVIFEVVEETLSFTSSSIAYRSTSSVSRIPTLYSSSSEYYRDDDKDDSATSPSLLISTIPEDPLTTTYTNSASTSASVWHVWTAADRLEQSINNNNDDDNNNKNKNTSSSSYYLYPASTKLIRTVISILRTLGTQHDGQKEWQGILNKSTLLHEIEESIVAIHFLQRELFLSSSSSSSSSEGTTTTTTSATQKEVIIVDACCGKGVFSLLCSYVFRQQRQENTISDDDDNDNDNDNDRGYHCNYHVRKIIMLDNAADLKWNHVDATNDDTTNAAITTNNRRPIIECWSRCNLHEIDTMVDRLSQEVQVVAVQQQQHPSEEIDEDEDKSCSSSSVSTTTTLNNAVQSPPILAVVGIHLCKTLSPTCIGIVNAIGPTICPFLVLAPCCLPRSVIRQSKWRTTNVGIRNKKKSSIEIRQYETPEERKNRNIAKIRRAAAMWRGRTGRGEKKKTNTSRPVTRGDQAIAILSHDYNEDNEDDDDDDTSSNAANECCWKCGEYGHVKANCPSTQSTGKPPLILPPQLLLDVSEVFLQREEEERPFLSYCNLLRTSIQRSTVLLEETDLNNKHNDDDTTNENNKSNKKNSNNNQKKNQTNNWNNERKSVYIVART